MNFREMTVPNVAIGALVRNIRDSTVGLHLFGTGAVSQNSRSICEFHTQFSNGHVEAQLHRLTKTIDSTSNDERVDILSRGAYNDAQQRDHVAADEEVSPAKQVRQSPQDAKDC